MYKTRNGKAIQTNLVHNLKGERCNIKFFIHDEEMILQFDEKWDVSCIYNDQQGGLNWNYIVPVYIFDVC